MKGSFYPQRGHDPHVKNAALRGPNVFVSSVSPAHPCSTGKNDFLPNEMLKFLFPVSVDTDVSANEFFADVNKPNWGHQGHTLADLTCVLMRQET